MKTYGTDDKGILELKFKVLCPECGREMYLSSKDKPFKAHDIYYVVIPTSCSNCSYLGSIHINLLPEN